MWFSVVFVAVVDFVKRFRHCFHSKWGGELQCEYLGMSRSRRGTPSSDALMLELERLMSEAFGGVSVDGMRSAIAACGPDADALRAALCPPEEDPCSGGALRDDTSVAAVDDCLDDGDDAIANMSLEQLRSLEGALQQKMNTSEPSPQIPPSASKGIRVAPPTVANQRSGGDTRVKKLVAQSGVISNSSSTAAPRMPVTNSKPASGTVSWTCDLCGTANVMNDPIRAVLRRSAIAATPNKPTPVVPTDVMCCSGCQFRPHTV